MSNLKTPADYQLWETFIQRTGAGDNFIIRPKNPHVMYKGDLNPEWAFFTKETFHLWFYGHGKGLQHPNVYKFKELIFSGKGRSGEVGCSDAIFLERRTSRRRRRFGRFRPSRALSAKRREPRKRRRM